jgi:hypothetical protein
VSAPDDDGVVFRHRSIVAHGEWRGPAGSAQPWSGPRQTAPARNRGHAYPPKKNCVPDLLRRVFLNKDGNPMKILLFAAALGCASAQPPDIGQIMSRVAANQERSQELRKNYVYSQKQLLRMVRGNGKVAREERREYVLSPQERGFRKELAGFEGKYESKGKYISYDQPGYEYKEMDIDGELIDELSDELTNDKQSRDGIGRNLFPLTSDEQAKYNFRLVRTETLRGRQVYRVAFEPKPRHRGLEEGSAFWKGEALIDAEEFQPVMVTSKMAPKIPLVVRTLLGTNLKGLGFSLTYEKFSDGVWFPVSYGGEFELRAVFFYKRTVSISMVNRDFRRTDVNSTIAYSTEDR